MIVLGITGSIGMGKSTTAAMFADAGIPVHSADASVHALYAGRAAPAVEALFPGTVRDGTVDRAALALRVLDHPQAMAMLEAVIHPMVREEEEAFLAAARASGATLAVLDIPLLFETGAMSRVDRVLVVSAPLDVQRARVLARPGMTEVMLAAILSRQLPDAEKRARADIVIDTSKGLEAVRAEVDGVIAALSAIGAG
ncbi:MAG: dephospho-CoA kinase [Rhizobiaceae bacterium]|nr:dephospho-CoA kinase [Rhizobiaceae bacterium]